MDYAVEAENIGDPEGTVSDTMRITEDPAKLRIAETAAEVIRTAGLIQDSFSYLTGTVWTSLAVTRFVRRMMEEAGVVGSFNLGGITAP